MQQKSKSVESWTVVGFRTEASGSRLERVYVLRGATTGRFREVAAADRAEVSRLLAEEARRAQEMVPA